MDTLDKDILDSVSIVREKSKRPDTESIFKHVSSTGATNIAMEVVEEIIELLIAKSKVASSMILEVIRINFSLLDFFYKKFLKA